MSPWRYVPNFSPLPKEFVLYDAFTGYKVLSFIISFNHQNDSLREREIIHSCVRREMRFRDVICGKLNIWLSYSRT